MTICLLPARGLREYANGMSQTSTLPAPAQSRRNVWVLVAAQAFLGAQMPMIFTIAGACRANPGLKRLLGHAVDLDHGRGLHAFGHAAIVGDPNIRAARRVLDRHGSGRYRGGDRGMRLYSASFPIFLLGARCFRAPICRPRGFTALPPPIPPLKNFRPKAISWVMAGGLLSAIIGPQLVKVTAQAFVVPFMGTYLAVIVLNIVGSFLFLGPNIPSPPSQNR